MKPIFYKSTNGECYKLEIQDGIGQSYIDAVLDGINEDRCTFISEEEFNKSAEKMMKIRVLDEKNTTLLAILTTKAIELDDEEKISLRRIEFNNN